MSRRASPPRTPPNIEIPSSGHASASSSDYSPIEELSFEYTFDAEGKYVRLAKSVHSSPPTPQDHDQELEPDEYEPQELRPKSPTAVTLNSPATRGSLSRSENAPPAERPSLTTQPSATSTRILQRVGSGPVSSTPSTTAAPLRHALSLTAGPPTRKIDRPQRVTLEEFREKEERNRRQVEELKARMEEEGRKGRYEEGENFLSEEDGGGPSGNQRRHLSLEPSQLGSSRSLGKGISASSSQTASTRGPRGMSASGASSSKGVRQPANGSTQQRERERLQVVTGSTKSGRVLKGGTSTKSTSAPAFAAPISEAPLDEDEYYEDAGYGYEHHQGDRDMVGDTDYGTHLLHLLNFCSNFIRRRVSSTLWSYRWYYCEAKIAEWPFFVTISVRKNTSKAISKPERCL